MKYIINESKVDLLKDNFLMSYVKDNVEIFDNFILIPDNDTLPREEAEPHMEYDYEDGRLWINPEFIQKFISIFGSNEESTKDYIKNWFEYTFKNKHVEVKFIET